MADERQERKTAASGASGAPGPGGAAGAPGDAEREEAAEPRRRGPGRPPSPVAVERLPKALQERVVEGLKKGWTVEGIVEAVNSESSGYRIADWSVENFFWSSPRLAEERILAKKEYVDRLLAAIGKPGSSEALMLNATLLTGLTDLFEKSRRIRAKDVASMSLKRETLQARQELAAIKVRRARKEEELMALRLEQIRRRNELLREQISQLRQLAHRDRTRLGPELMHQIKQIYGLACLPDIPAERVREE